MRYRAVVSLLAAGGVGAGVCLALTAEAPRTISAQPAAQPGVQSEEVKGQIAFARSLSDAFHHAAQVIGPSVVHITQMNRVLVRRSFFDPGEAQIAPTGLGSGVIVTDNGYILTNNHVIANADRLTVKLSDQREFPATVVGTDPASDLAVLKIEASALPAAQFADSDSLQVGEWVLAVGSPFGFDNTVTAGIVSAMGRVGLTAQTDESYQDFIQTDAAINPGNSGGPLVNLDGRVIGINDQIATRGGGSVGLGFAIPSSIAEPVADAIMKSGRVERGWVGVVMKDMPVQAEGVRGVLIERLVDGGPAAAAGVEEGDVVTRFNGRPIWSSNRLRNAIAFTPPGSEVPVEVVRGGQPVTLVVSLSDRISGEAGAVGEHPYRELGMAVTDFTQEMAQGMRYPWEVAGVIVTKVEPGGPAERAGFRVRDLILEVNEQAVRRSGDLHKALGQATPRQPLRFGARRLESNGFQTRWDSGYLVVTPRN